MRIKKILTSFLGLSLFGLPAISISCIRYPNDSENVSLNESIENKSNIVEIKLENKPTLEIKKIYDNELLKLFLEVKQTYRNYRKRYIRIIRRIDAFRNKVAALIIDQGKPENSKKINDFFVKWLEEAGKQKTSLAKLLDKYQLIFQDVDAVLNDVNLVFDNQQFIKFIEIIDKRLSGKDINLGELQKSIIDAWDFLRKNVFNEKKVSKIEDLDKINIESDKNSHTHSHAIVNLTFEMGLWHLLLKKSVKDQKIIGELKKDFKVLKENVIDNIGQKNYESDYNFLIKLFSENMDFNKSNNLINDKYQAKAKQIMESIKKILIDVAKKEGISDKLNLN
ncbi:HxHSH motif-containing lipoprotein [Mycoplasma sp. 332]|uniref:HxHSH motif-containing lipoprotein n=1 Tax=Mycoplasma sp. 332 TaxID=3458236 RepID=UPI0040367755